MGLYKLTFRPQNQQEDSTLFVEAGSIGDAIQKLNDSKKDEVTEGQEINVTSVEAIQEEFLK